ncbi:MAG: iron ABC transporter substrate-binding protein [Kiritimatiellae bacterium]|nr:iron ABC transporter substrate-binding protein [Kiritimatiellia bacterium]
MNQQTRRIARGTAVLAVTGLIAAFLHVFACPHSNGGAGIRVTDLAGRKVSVPGKVSRLVALGPGALRLVTYLDAANRVVGIDAMEKRMARDVYARPYAHALGESFLHRPVVGAGGPGVLPEPENLMMCRPDLIVAVGMDPGQLDNIQAKTGVPTLGLSYGGIGVWRDEVRRSLCLLGEVLGRNGRAAEVNGYVTSMEQDLKRRTSDIADSDRPSAYVGGISQKGSHGLTSTEAGYPPARMAGARNLADGLGKSGHVFVDKEQILVWNPEFIFVDAASRPLLDQDFEKNRDFYRLMNAAKSGKMFSLLPYNAYNTNIELALLNAYFIGKTLYPERFSDIRMKEKAREIMGTLLGIRPDQTIPAYHSLRFPETGPVVWR